MSCKNWCSPLMYFVLSALLIVSITLYSCKNNTVSPVSQTGSVSLKADNNAFSDASNTIALDSAKILLMDVQYIGSGNDTSVLKVGPIVIHINLTGVLTPVATNSIKAETFKAVLFKIHKHVPNEPVIDTDFGTSVGYSTVIAGTFNGVYFLYRSAITAVQNMPLNKLLVVPSNTTVSVNVTIAVNPSLWFLDSNGNVLDPNNPLNQNVIDNNIQTSFKTAFVDNDKNGIPDP